MKVLITGGAGLIGKAATERFLRQGWEVRIIGLETDIEVQGAEFAVCDIMNYDDLREQMRGCQAVVHLAAIRGPLLAPGHKIFEVNVSGTFNVFEAAAAAGIHRVVQASSINALGAAWGVTDIAITYFPVDEEHPSFTTDPYSFSKELVENIGHYFWRRDGISSVALRFPGVYEQGLLNTDEYRNRRDSGHILLDEFAALAPMERDARLAEVRVRSLEYRRQRSLEFKEAPRKWPSRNENQDQLWYTYTFDRFNLWAFIDVRDAALALEKGVTADYEGAHALFINDHHNSIGYDSRSLIRTFFPEVNESTVNLSGSEALVSIDKARKLIGFEPEFSVANWV